MKKYNKANIPIAKALRKNMTQWEKKLWYEYLRFYPVRFQRQKALGNYIADFYCAKAQLVIEIDGKWHYNTEIQYNKDEARTTELEKLNLKVLRIANSEIDKNFSGVCGYIDMAVKSSTPPSNLRFATSPDKGRQNGCMAPSDEGRQNGCMAPSDEGRDAYD